MNSCEIEKKRDSAGTVFSLNVSYSYEVLGQKYRGNRISFFWVLFFIIAFIISGLLFLKMDLAEIDRIEVLSENC
jgi:hypothetical protein